MMYHVLLRSLKLSTKLNNMRDISLHILDLVQNSISAKAKNISISLNYINSDLFIDIIDDGLGMSEEVLKNVTSPFYTSRTTRKVGFGIPLYIQNAELSGGYVKLDSIPGKGTSLKACFKTDNIDCLALGDICETFLSLIISNPDNVDFNFSLKRGKKEANLSTSEIKSVLAGVSIAEPSVISWISDCFDTEFKPLLGGY